MRSLLGAAALAIALSGCTLSVLNPAVNRATPAVTVGEWTIQVSVQPTRVRQLTVSVGPARGAPRNEAHPWIQHGLVLENVGHRPLLLMGVRSPAAFIGPAGHRRRLLATAGLCGYVPEGSSSKLEIACRLVLDVTDLKPGAKHRGTVTLFKELRGMEPLVDGTFTFDFRFRIGRPSRPEAKGRAVALKLVYEFTRDERPKPEREEPETAAASVSGSG
jgi:hypothetical protein